MGFSSFGLDAAHKRMLERMARTRDLTQPMAVVASDVVAMTQRAIDTQQSPSGKVWRPLAASTLRQRKPGEPRIALHKTGARRRTVRAFPHGSGIRLIFDEILRIHAGSHRASLPVRNPFPFERDGDGRWRPIPKLAQHISLTIVIWIDAGKTKTDVPLAAEEGEAGVRYVEGRDDPSRERV